MSKAQFKREYQEAVIVDGQVVNQSCQVEEPKLTTAKDRVISYMLSYLDIEQAQAKRYSKAGAGRQRGFLNKLRSDDGRDAKKESMVLDSQQVKKEVKPEVLEALARGRKK